MIEGYPLVSMLAGDGVDVRHRLAWTRARVDAAPPRATDTRRFRDGPLPARAFAGRHRHAPRRRHSFIRMPALNAVALSTARLSMRPLRSGDADALFAVFSDPRVARYGSVPAWETIERAVDKIGRNERGMATGESVCLAVLRKQDQRLLGTADLFSIDTQSRRAEIGYGLAFDAWGHGYMHEALIALLDHAFSIRDLNRIEADVDPRNAASLQSLTRLGFQREGLLRQRWIVGGEISDSAIYGLLRDEWAQRPRSSPPAAR